MRLIEFIDILLNNCTWTFEIGISKLLLNHTSKSLQAQSIVGR